jgi:hypothetical protein
MPTRLPRHLLVARPPRSRAGRLLHRMLDRQADAALDRDRDPGRQPTAAEMGSFAMTHDRERRPRVLLMEVEARVSERTGRPWYSAWLGKARLIGFEADEPNERGHRSSACSSRSPSHGMGRRRPLQSCLGAIRDRDGQSPSARQCVS